MKMDEMKQLSEILKTKHFGVFTTIHNNSPHSTLVCFGVSEDLGELFFLTPTHTRKFVNLHLYQRVSLFVDNTSNQPDEIFSATTVSANGTVRLERDMTDEERKRYIDLYLKKNPHMEFFVKPSVSLVVIKVDRYEIVRNFQTVERLAASKNYQLTIRQIQGQSISGGIGRGKLVAVNSEDDLNRLEEDSIALLEENIVLKIKPKGIVSSKKLDNVEQIPTVLLEDTSFLTEGMTVTVNGDLGIVTIHDIR